MFNYSFWADEAYIAGVAARWITGKYTLLTAFNAPAIAYQRLQMIIIGLSFKLFGISEFSARLPSMIAFVIGIPIIFLITKKLSNLYGAVIGTILYSFSVLNLAYATQAKPYSLIGVIMMIVILLLIYLSEEKRSKYIFIYNILIIGCLIFATFLHNIGVLLWGIYFVYQVLTFKRFNVFVLVGVVITLPIVLSSIKIWSLFPYNNLYQVSKLFLYKYTFISIGAFLGFITLFKSNKKIAISLLAYIVTLLLLASFRIYIFNLRYVLSLFPIMFICFGIFIAALGKKYGSNLVTLLTIIIFIIFQYKIAVVPRNYYNPNIDKYGDVQIANYKDFYHQLKNKFPNYSHLYIVNDTYDAEYWYLGRYSNAYFMKFTTKPYKHHTANAMIYGSLNDFKKIIQKHSRGLLIIEDWESFLPEDVKQYAKKNLKLELRVDSLKEATNDPWPLALYSWGIK